MEYKYVVIWSKPLVEVVKYSAHPPGGYIKTAKTENFSGKRGKSSFYGQFLSDKKISVKKLRFRQEFSRFLCRNTPPLALYILLRVISLHYKNFMRACERKVNKYFVKNWKFSKIPPGGSCGAIWMRIGSSCTWWFSHQECVFQIVKKCILKSDLLLPYRSSKLKVLQIFSNSLSKSSKFFQKSWFPLLSKTSGVLVRVRPTQGPFTGAL